MTARAPVPFLALALALLLAGTLLASPPSAASRPRESARPADRVQFGTPAHETVNATATLGNRLVVGGSTGGALPGHTSAGGDDAFLQVLTPTLRTRWSVQLGSPSHDEVHAMDAHPGTVVAGGYTAGTLPGADGSGSVWLGGWSTHGTRQWLRQFEDGPAGSVESIVVRGRYAYAAGQEADISGNRAWVRKLDVVDGAVIWQRSFALDTHSYVAGVVELDGWVYVVGTSSGSEVRGFLTRFSTDGRRGWTRRPTGWLEAVTTDGRRIYLAGYVGSEEGALVAAYSRNGRRLWRRVFTGDDGNAAASSLAWTGSRLAVGGYVHGALPGGTNQGGWDLFVRTYSPSGTAKWTHQLGTAASEYSPLLEHGRYGLYLAAAVAGPLGGPALGSTDVAVIRFARARPDLYARTHGGSWRGKDRYRPKRQVVSSRVRRGRTVTFYVRPHNDGEEIEQLQVKGCRNPRGLRVEYHQAGGRDITEAVRRGSWHTEVLHPRKRSFLGVRVRANRRAPRGARGCRIVARSIAQGVSDALTLRIRVTR